MKPLNRREIDSRVFAPNFAMQDSPPDQEIPEAPDPSPSEEEPPMEETQDAPPEEEFAGDSIQPNSYGPRTPYSKPVEGRYRPHGKPFPFALAHGEDGASIWWGQLAAMVCTATVTRKDGNVVSITQDTISTTLYYAPENLDTDTRLQTHLGWYGDVYLYWEADEGGTITAVEIKGPDTPDGENIGPLDADLHREITSGKYYVKIGSVPEDGLVDQQISSDVPWFATILKGSSTDSSDGSQGSEGSTGSEPSTGSTGSDYGSDKSTAIVPVSFYSTGHAALFTVEAPEVRFEDIVVVFPKRRKMTLGIDPRFEEVCELNSLRVISAVPSAAAMVGATMKGRMVTLDIHTPHGRKLPESITLKISGIRRGFAGLRMPSKTLRQFLANEKFLKSAHPRE